MGRGDKRTRRGKIFAGSFGKTRPRKKVKNTENKENKPEKTEGK
jgi:30S ribosomal protein S31